MVKDAQELAAEILHERLLPLQKKALWYLAAKMGRNELQCVCEDFLLARGEIAIDAQTVKDVIDFYYNR